MDLPDGEDLPGTASALESPAVGAEQKIELRSDQTHHPEALVITREDALALVSAPEVSPAGSLDRPSRQESLDRRAEHRQGIGPPESRPQPDGSTETADGDRPAHRSPLRPIVADPQAPNSNAHGDEPHVASADDRPDDTEPGAEPPTPQREPSTTLGAVLHPTDRPGDGGLYANAPALTLETGHREPLDALPGSQPGAGTSAEHRALPATAPRSTSAPRGADDGLAAREVERIVTEQAVPRARHEPAPHMELPAPGPDTTDRRRVPPPPRRRDNADKTVVDEPSRHALAPRTPDTVRSRATLRDHSNGTPADAGLGKAGPPASRSSEGSRRDRARTEERAHPQAHHGGTRVGTSASATNDSDPDPSRVSPGDTEANGAQVDEARSVAAGDRLTVGSRREYARTGAPSVGRGASPSSDPKRARVSPAASTGKADANEAHVREATRALRDAAFGSDRPSAAGSPLQGRDDSGEPGEDSAPGRGSVERTRVGTDARPANNPNAPRMPQATLPANEEPIEARVYDPPTQRRRAPSPSTSTSPPTTAPDGSRPAPSPAAFTRERTSSRPPSPNRQRADDVPVDAKALWRASPGGSPAVGTHRPDETRESELPIQIRIGKIDARPRETTPAKRVGLVEARGPNMTLQKYLERRRRPGR
jgi:hypothetical protein